MRVVQSDLKLDYLFVVYPGELSYLLDKKIEVIPLELAKSRIFGLQ